MAKKTAGGRAVPRPFEFHWGGGQIVEEAGDERQSLPVPLDRSVPTDHGQSPRSWKRASQATP